LVERVLAKHEVVGSKPITRSIDFSVNLKIQPKAKASRVVAQ
jgi:hypothetical protein